MPWVKSRDTLRPKILPSSLTFHATFLYLQVVLQALLKWKTVRGRQGIRVVAGVVVAAAAARELAGLAGGALGYARVPLHLVDDVKVRVVHGGRRARRRAVPVARPVAGISPAGHVHVIGDADAILRR